ncbi:MAG TPA: hypothetical protein VKU90_16935 [Caulobacteraceae bacterium]|nr:hypothetical protein [Caulobacteraceae bacterium]
MLWIPRAENPGIPAVLLFLARQALLSVPLMLVAYLLFASVATAAGWPASVYAFVTPALVFGGLEVVPGLARYSFVRHAQRPLRALGIFTATVIAMLVLFYHGSPYVLAWMIPVQFAAGAAMYFGVRRRLYAPALVLAIFTAQTTLDVAMPNFVYDPRVADAPPPLDPEPTTDGMPTWGKLYPGAVVRKSETSGILGLTDWDATYTVQATPAQIDSFYKATADATGFNDEMTLAGDHRFTQDSSQDWFSYMIIANGSRPEVLFSARARGSR